MREALIFIELVLCFFIEIGLGYHHFLGISRLSDSENIS